MSSKRSSRARRQAQQRQQTAPIQQNTSAAPEQETIGNADSIPTSVAEQMSPAAGLEKDISVLEELKRTAEKELEAVNANIQEKTVQLGELEPKVNALISQRDTLQPIVEGLQGQADSLISEAQKKADEMTENAESAARQIRETATREAMEEQKAAHKKAQDAWREHSRELEEQREDLSSRELELNKAQRALQRERENLEYDRETLAEEREYVAQLKNRFSAVSPAAVEAKTRELEEKEQLYTLLLEKYNDLSRRLQEAQVALDTVRAEIPDPTGKVRSVSLSAIVDELRDFRERYEQLSSVYSRYPDDASVAALEERAGKADRLEAELYDMTQERDRFRAEVMRAQSSVRELEAIRQQVDAANALNEHLLQELESQKTALESRTGDTCPALTKVDTETEEPDFVQNLADREKKKGRYGLKELVTFIRNYAGNGGEDRVPLYYEEDDIRAFLAGMAVSRLLILEGMSGTGKSSLPRIVAEAISGFSRLIPVESSWRDRNELLGYYNDFNKKFNAKTFTVELYRSSKERCREVPTFIILDEMNLARIEYYFSDFLAVLQEPDHEKWLIELISSDMRTLPMELPQDVKRRMQEELPGAYAVWEKIERSRQGELNAEPSDEEKELLTTYLARLGRLTGAKDLVDGRKIRVTDNVWFIGTANQDESTFEISDKVYDRSQIVALNKKGVPAADGYSPVKKSFVPVSKLEKLFNEAIAGKADVIRKDVERRLDAIDEVLMEWFDTSFGNRIVTQAIDFAAVFCAAGGTVTDALDYQISTKIFRKVKADDDSDAFAALLEVTEDYPRTKKLIEKRLRDLE